MHPSWFKTYDEPPTGGILGQSWDTAVKTGVRNDWSVGITAIYYQKRYYILDVFRGRVTFGELRRKLNELCRKYQVERLLIEDASSGQELIQLLHEDLPDGVPRPIAITPLGDVVLPQAAPWKADFVAEVAARPGGRHDDQSDALAQMMANPPPTLPSTPMAGPRFMTRITDGAVTSLADMTTLGRSLPTLPTIRGPRTLTAISRISRICPRHDEDIVGCLAGPRVWHRRP